VNDDAAARFEPHRRVLVAHAYRMLGEHAEAEDIVQEAYLRWDQALARTAVEDDRGFLRATVTRLALDRLRSARARREVYVGPWLPEPLLDEAQDGPDAVVALADDVSFALLLALERLSPLERAAFLLHDALDVPFAEIAQTLGRSELAVRRLASRAREHVREARSRNFVAREDALRMRDAFLAALRGDDLAALQRLLTADVVLTSDGGGKAVAAIVPLVGPDRVGRFLLGIARKSSGIVRAVVPARINTLPGFVLLGEHGVLQTFALDLDGERIRAIYVTRNPDKLRGVEARLGNIAP
jgi:RNA polymerase sigma-70 factor (ECF subfamily)